MNAIPPGLCPLCGQSFPRGQLHLHIAAEQPLIRQYIMAGIKASHPGWSHEQGACPNCWDLHRGHLNAASASAASVGQAASQLGQSG
jgi:hypothetical protein